MLEREFRYFLDHQEELVEQYNGRYVVIVGEEVVGDYQTETEAYYTSLQTYQLGEFLIQKVEPGEDVYTQNFHSRVVFA